LANRRHRSCGQRLRRAYARERGVFAMEGDVRDEKTASNAVKAILHRFSRLDAVVSNAGIMIRLLMARIQSTLLVESVA
jgi:NAD(P)-dependent dehydrogenase (short-subunit alcohol dehydrogenase family)